jgi:hypothetical protein
MGRVIDSTCKCGRPGLCVCQAARFFPTCEARSSAFVCVVWWGPRAQSTDRPQKTENPQLQIAGNAAQATANGRRRREGRCRDCGSAVRGARAAAAAAGGDALLHAKTQDTRQCTWASSYVKTCLCLGAAPPSMAAQRRGCTEMHRCLVGAPKKPQKTIEPGARPQGGGGPGQAGFAAPGRFSLRVVSQLSGFCCLLSPATLPTSPKVGLKVESYSISCPLRYDNDWSKQETLPTASWRTILLRARDSSPGRDSQALGGSADHSERLG